MDLSGHTSQMHRSSQGIVPTLLMISRQKSARMFPTTPPLRTQDLQGKSIRASAGRLSQVLRGPRKDLMRDQRG